MKEQKTRHVDDPVAVGRRLKEARQRAGLTQKELAGDSCAAAYISRLELGQRIPSIQLLRRLGKRLGVNADFLATGAEPGAATYSALVEAEVALRFDDVATARRLYGQVLAEANGARGQRSDALAGLGQLALREGRCAEAVELLSQAVEARGVDAVELPAVASSLARAYAAVGELSPALALLERCVEKYEGSNDVLQYVRFASMLGYALTDARDFAGAERVVAHALARAHDVTDPYARARLYWSQSRLLAEQAQPDAAETYALKTLETLRTTEDGHAIAQAIEMLAHIYVELGRGQEALDLLDEGEPLIEATGSLPEVAHYRLERARALAALGRYDDAAPLAMQLAGELADVQPIGRGRAYLLLARIFEELAEPDRARELYELAIDCLEAQPPSRHLVAAYQSLAQLLKSRGQRDEALELLERALTTQARTGHRLGTTVQAG